MTLNTPTRKVETQDSLTQEFASLHSVELTNTVKDGWRVSAVKVYANDPHELAEMATQVALEATARLGRVKAGMDRESAS